MKNIVIRIINFFTPDLIKKKLLGIWLRNDEFRLFCKGKLIDSNDLFLNRFLWSDLNQTQNIIRERFGNNQPVTILTDRFDVPSNLKHSVVNIDDFEPGILSNLNIYICAFNSDEKLVEVLNSLKSYPNIHYYNPFRLLPTARYFHRSTLVHDTLIHEFKAKHGKFDLADFENIIQAIDITQRIEGDYVEIGVYRGDSAHLALKYMKNKGIERRSYFFDLFEGFTNMISTLSSDSVWINSHVNTSISDVKDYLNEFTDISVEKLDIIANNLPNAINNIAICNIDVDIYEATLAALSKVSPLIVKGGIMIVEDQGHTPLLAGAYLAVQEFLKSKASSNFIPVHLDSGQMYFIKK